MSNLIPIQITLQAATAADARQLVQDLAGTMQVLPPEQIPLQTQVSAVSAPAVPLPPQAPVTPQAQPTTAPAAAPATPPAAVPIAGQAPAAAPSSPAATASVPTAAVPTAAQTYTLDQLAVAATSLMDAGYDIVPLLGEFGVQALTLLPKEQYGNFATRLRAMGAKI